MHDTLQFESLMRCVSDWGTLLDRARHLPVARTEECVASCMHRRCTWTTDHANTLHFHAHSRDGIQCLPMRLVDMWLAHHLQVTPTSTEHHAYEIQAQWYFFMLALAATRLCTTPDPSTVHSQLRLPRLSVAQYRTTRFLSCATTLCVAMCACLQMQPALRSARQKTLAMAAWRDLNSSHTPWSTC